MKKIKNEFGLKQKSKGAIAIALAMIIAITLITLKQLNHDIKTSIENSVIMTLHNVTEQSAKVVYKELNTKQKFLSALVEGFYDDESGTDTERIDKMAIYAKAYGMYDIGILYPDGVCHLEGGKTIDLKESDCFLNSFSGQAVVTKSYLSNDGNSTYLNIFTMPIEKDGSILAVLVAAYESDDFFNLLRTDSFGGTGKSVVVDSDGKAVIVMSDQNSENQADLIEYIYNDPEISPNSNENNFFSFSYGGETYLSCMKEIGVNDWYILTYVDKTSVFYEANLIQKSIFVISGILLGIIAITLIILVVIVIKYQRGIYKVVFMDELSGEKNYEYLKVWFDNLAISRKKNLFLVVLDIDGFKALNMSYGNTTGDAVLRYISRVFKEICPEDQIYRSHSDHYAAIMHGDNKSIIEKKLDRLLYKIQMDIKTGVIVPFVLSIGACSLEGIQSLHNGYTNATLAKDNMKGNYVDQYAFFEDSLREVSIRNMELRSAFDSALRNKEFKVVYQPKFDMKTEKIVGAEALVRWIKRDGQMVFPDEFISCFEESEQIIQLDEYVFETVCAEMEEMQTKGLPVKCVSVNLSRVHMKSSIIINKLREIAGRYSIAPENIAIELTESTVFGDFKKVCSLVNELHKSGFRVDMDDYGTGISSLLSLANADFDVIKLDKSFVNKIGNRKMEKVIKSTIDLAGQLDLSIVAEGVENKEQADFLLSNGCRIAQGYYYSKPISKEDYEEMLHHM